MDFQDVVTVFSTKGWKQFCEEMHRLESEDVAEISDFVNKSTACVIHKDNVLLRFDSQSTNQSGFFNFTDTLNNVDRDGFLFVSLTQDGTEIYLGEYYNNPFDVGITKVIAYNTAGNYAENIIPTASSNASNVNDHTCMACGNTKCSKVEKSCWKCGHLIQ